MDVISFLIRYFQFPLQLAICTFPFYHNLPDRRHFPARIITAMAAFLVFLLPWTSFWSSRLYIGVASLFYYLGIAAAGGAVIYATKACGFTAVAYAVTGGYTAQHIGFCVFRMLYYSLLTSRGRTMTELFPWTWMEGLAYFGVYVLVSVLVWLVFIRPSRKEGLLREGDPRILAVGAVALFMVLILSILVHEGEDVHGYSYMTDFLCPIYAIVVCLLCLALESGIFKNNRLAEEKRATEQLLAMARDQQRTSREAINIINIKCHDLKHQLKRISAADDAAQRKQYIEEAREAINIYDASFRTGCEALDYVLREKELLAREGQVDFTCIADGAKLSFLSAPDVYALFGNAIDNALERQKKEPAGHRFVRIQIRERAGVVVMTIENACTTPVQFDEEGLPQTDKPDKTRHGFGVRSIRYITDKYHGTMSMQQENGSFVLRIMLPEQ